MFNVLIVDDEPDLEVLIRQRFRKRIKDGDFQFVFARNGQEALNKLHEDPSLDLVISDINMPVMDGLTLLLRLADVDRLLKAVVVSAYGDMQNIRTAMNRGAYDFLIKPIDFQDFELTLDRALREMEDIKRSLKTREELTVLQYEQRVAARIQHSVLPHHLTPFPNRTDFDIYGHVSPATEVGADFYDFFLLDEDRLGFVMGDVSGKGVPAAIFMALCRSVLKATALRGISPSDCLKYVNDELIRQNASSMFLAAFYGVLHTNTGKLEYCRAGHKPPYILTKSGDLKTLDEPAGTMAGALENATFKTGKTTLPLGGYIALFSDGVTGSVNADGESFGEQRLRDLAGRLPRGSAEELVNNVIQGVNAFAAGVPPTDDITALVLRYTGSSV